MKYLKHNDLEYSTVSLYGIAKAVSWNVLLLKLCAAAGDESLTVTKQDTLLERHFSVFEKVFKIQMESSKSVLHFENQNVV